MKKSLLLLFLLLPLLSLGQDSQQKNFPRPSKERKKPAACPRVYLGLSTGINNNNGLLGVSVDVAVVDAFSVGGGVGISSWGTKVYGEGRFYLDPCNRGWAFGAAVTHNTGSEDLILNVETKYYGTMDATIDQIAKTNLALSAYRFWTLGRRQNRLFLQLGWSVPLTETRYVVRNGVELAPSSDQAVRALSPGGLVIGFGLSFGLHANN